MVWQLSDDLPLPDCTEPSVTFCAEGDHDVEQFFRSWAQVLKSSEENS